MTKLKTITQEEANDLHAALVVDLEQINKLGRKYTKLYTTQDDTDGRNQMITEILAGIAALRFGGEGEYESQIKGY